MTKVVILIIAITTAYFSYSQSSEDSSADEYIFGNKWYSRQNILINHSIEMGVSGSKDFFTETFLFKYRFSSNNRHGFAIRGYHHGFAPGLFTNNLKFFNFGIFAGFEYLVKIFSNTEGFFAWADVGGCNGGFAFDAGIGIGSRVKNGFDFIVEYMQDVGVFSRMEFYFLLFNIMTLRGKLGLDVNFKGTDIEFFSFLGAMSIGLFIKDTFKIELGGGFTFNEYAYFSGFGCINIAFQFL